MEQLADLRAPRPSTHEIKHILSADELLFQQARDLLVRGVEKSIADHVPAHPVRDFLLWAFSGQNPERERWLHLIGISQTIRLSLKLLDGLTDSADYARLIEHSLPMSVYQFYEIVSDNLSIGLGSPIADDHAHEERRALVLAFNQAMAQRLGGDARSARELLAPQREPAGRISLLRNTLNTNAYQRIVFEYLATRPSVSLEEIDSAVWPLLVGNIESCAELTRGLRGYACGPLTVQGLCSRYTSVSALLSEPDMLLSRRITHSADAILVMPTLSYLICVLKEILEPADTIVDCLRGGVLGEALYTAALLVRLLNDVGTPLLFSAEARADLLHALRDRAGDGIADPEPRTLKLGAHLLALRERFGNTLSRIVKDLVHGESNICTFGLGEQDLLSSLSALELRLDYIAELYAQAAQYLARVSAEASRRLRDERPMLLVRRFVRFHEHLYAQPYDDTSGEYSG